MNQEKTAIKILKIIVIVGGGLMALARFCTKTEYVNICMAIVNVISFTVSVNILMIDLYEKIKQVYRKNKDSINFIKVMRISAVAMLSYLMIFIFEVCLLILFVFLYGFSGIDITLCNDMLGIASLILAISYDLIGDICVAFILRVI